MLTLRSVLHGSQNCDNGQYLKKSSSVIGVKVYLMVSIGEPASTHHTVFPSSSCCKLLWWHCRAPKRSVWGGGCRSESSRGPSSRGSTRICWRWNTSGNGDERWLGWVRLHFKGHQLARLMEE